MFISQAMPHTYQIEYLNVDDYFLIKRSQVKLHELYVTQILNILVGTVINFSLYIKYDLIWFLVFNATFSNISSISWRPLLVVEEVGVPGENHRPLASNWNFITCGCESSAAVFVKSCYVILYQIKLQDNDKVDSIQGTDDNYTRNI